MYNMNNKITQSVAEAVRRVMENKEDFKPHMMYDPKTGKGYEAKTHEDHLKFKDMGYTHEKNETEVQDSDKDFVDTHSVDAKENPEKKRQVEEIEDEDDVEEGNAFGQAVTDAKKAGKKKFKFQGKEYKVESANLEEAKGFPESSQGAKMTYDRVVKLSASLKKGSNLNKAVNKRLGGKYDSDFAKMEKAIATIFNTLDEIDREYVMSDFDESANLEEAKEIKLAGKPSTKITTKGKKTIISVAGGENVTVNLPVDKVVSIGKAVGIWDGKKVNKAIEGPDAWEDFDDEVEKAGGEITLPESTNLDEASNADLKKVLATAKNIGGVVKGNTADFGQGAVIDFSIEKGKIKFDGGMSSGVEYFNNVKDAISALMIGFDE